VEQVGRKGEEKGSYLVGDILGSVFSLLFGLVLQITIHIKMSEIHFVFSWKLRLKPQIFLYCP